MDKQRSIDQDCFAGRLLQLIERIAEEMVGRFNPPQRLGLGGFRKNGFHGGTPPVLVVGAVEKMHAAAAIGEKIPFTVLDRRTNRKEALHAGVFAANDA